MSDQRKSGIEWTDQTWNPIRGCSKVSQGCKYCYAEAMAARFSGPGQPYEKVITNGRWNGDVVLVADHLADPLRWQRPRRVFVNSMSDLFHESLAFEDIAAVFGVMAAAPRHTFQVLTKRPARAVEFFDWYEGNSGAGANPYAAMYEASSRLRDYIIEPDIDVSWPLPNIWLGVSIEDQTTADERIPLLLQCPAAVRWVSAEPLLGTVNLRSSVGGTLWIGGQRGCGAMHNGIGTPECPRERHHHHDDRCNRGLDWVVVGGESGPGARPMHPDWARSLRDQCVGAGVPFLFKQWGDWCPRSRGYVIDDEKPRVRLTYCGCNGQSDLPLHGVPGSWTGRHECDISNDVWMGRVGKHAAGRELDGKVWDGYPKAVAS